MKTYDPKKVSVTFMGTKIEGITTIELKRKPPTVCLLTRSTTGATLCDPDRGSKLGVYVGTRSMKKTTCHRCLVIWDAWLEWCARHPPVPSRAEVRQVTKWISGRSARPI